MILQNLLQKTKYRLALLSFSCKISNAMFNYRIFNIIQFLSYFDTTHKKLMCCILQFLPIFFDHVQQRDRKTVHVPFNCMQIPFFGYTLQ